MELLNKMHKLLESHNEHTIETLQDIVSQLRAEADHLKDQLDIEESDAKRTHLEEEYQAVQRLLYKTHKRLTKIASENE